MVCWLANVYRLCLHVKYSHTKIRRKNKQKTKQKGCGGWGGGGGGRKQVECKKINKKYEHEESTVAKFQRLPFKPQKTHLGEIFCIVVQSFVS